MIITKRLLIRPIQPSNYIDLLKVYQVKENMQFILSGKYDWTLDELKEKWQEEKWNHEEQHGFLVVCLKSENQLIGEAGLLKTKALPSEALEVGYLIDKKYWRQGLGTEICKALIEYGFSTLHLKRIIAGMYKANIASAKIVQKLGMQLSKEGVSGAGIAFQEYELWEDLGKNNGTT